MIDPDDPLAGANPVSREQIDVLPLHGARRELLGEIMSMPSNATSTSGRSRLLLSVAAAVVIAVLAGGVWFAVSGLSGSGGPDKEAPVAGAGSSGSSTSASETPATATPTRDAALVNQKTCDRLKKRSRWVAVLGVERKSTLRKSVDKGTRYTKTRQGRWVRIVDGRCRYVDPDSKVAKRLEKIRLPRAGGIVVLELLEVPHPKAPPAPQPSQSP